MGRSGPVKFDSPIESSLVQVNSLAVQSPAVAPHEANQLSAATSNRSKFALFSTPYELAQMWLPILLLCAAVVELFWSHRFFSDEALVLNFIQNIIFLNSAHVLLTFFLLWSNRSGREWARGIFATTSFRLRSGAVFLGAAGLYYFYRQAAPGYDWATTVFDVILIMAGRHHEVSQSRGISLLYDSKFCDKKVFQHKLFPIAQYAQSIFAFSSATFTFFTLTSYRSRSPIYDLAEKSFRLDIWKWLWISSFIVSLGCLVLLFYSSIRIYPSGMRKQKILFNLRYPIKLLSPFSSLAAFFSNGTHGIEYLAVYSKLDRNEERTVSKRRFIVFLMASFSAFIFLRYIYVFAPGLEQFPALISLGMAVIAGLTFLHYFFDAYLFRHSDPLSKDLIISKLKQ